MANSQKPDFVFEVSWETVNKVGGIHTVITTKAREMVNQYGANYYLVGPYFKEKTVGQFKEFQPPEYFVKVLYDLEKQGIKAHFGRWQIVGEPLTILLEFDGLMPYTDSIKKELWDYFKVDSLGASADFNEPVVWGFAVGKFLELLAKSMPDKVILSQFHEWLSGSAILYLKNKNIKIATIFTTHATVLGRSLAGRNVDFYSDIKAIDAEKEARMSFVHYKHQLEKSAAQNTDVFTTVSQITAMEAESFLERKADVILPNGLDIAKFPTIEEITNQHRIKRNRLREFLIYYFFPYYTFDVRQTLFYFLGARYEYHNKGVDVFIKSLAKLNQKLKEENFKKTIVSFIWVPTAVSGINPVIIKSRELLRSILSSLGEIHEDLDDSILQALLTQEQPKVEDLFDEDFLRNLRKQIGSLKGFATDGPLLSTHILTDSNDTILRALKENGLTNKADDKVKVVYYPIYSSGSDGVLDLEYYESIQGSHFGVFPSFYEPWGYTPLESAGLGVASATTDLSGFGRYFKEKVKGVKFPGVYVFDRFQKNDDEVTESLVNVMYEYAKFSQRERVQNKIAAYNLAAEADWSIFVKEYFKAHQMALDKVFK